MCVSCHRFQRLHFSPSSDSSTPIFLHFTSIFLFAGGTYSRALNRKIRGCCQEVDSETQSHSRTRHSHRITTRNRVTDDSLSTFDHTLQLSAFSELEYKGKIRGHKILMLPPPGLESSLASLLQDATPTSLLSAVIETATSTLASAVVSTATAVSSSSSPKPDPDNGECQLLGPFAIFVQGALGCLALLALVYKRWRERPQRPLKIWFFDVSKQVVGSVLVHIANLLMSMLSSGQFSIKLDPNSVVTRRMTDEHGRYKPNPCSFYLLNLAIDVSYPSPAFPDIGFEHTLLTTCTDNDRNSHSYLPSSHPHSPLCSNTHRQPTRIHRVW